MKRSNNIIALITAGFLSTNLIWSAEYGYSKEDQSEILRRNKNFSDTLSSWECKEFTLVNNTPAPCTVQADNECLTKIEANGTWNFPGRGTKYFSLLLTEVLGVFHIDSKSRDAKQHIITLDPFRSAEKMKKALESKVNQDFRPLFASQRIYEILFENHTNRECVVRLNEGCEYTIAAKNDRGPGEYNFNRKHEPHHAFDLIQGTGRLSIQYLRDEEYKVILEPNPSDAALVDELLESFAGHRIGALAKEILEARKPSAESK